MNEYESFNNQPPTGTLPQWATITQVSDFLGIPRNAIRSAVRRAVANGEDWVKKETSEEGKPLYQLDTKHEAYQLHEDRWKHNKAVQHALLEYSVSARPHAWQSRFSPLRFERERLLHRHSSHAFSSRDALTQRESTLHDWPRIRQWLCTKGIQIFKNILAEEEQATSWQWRWNELHGEGCQSEEEAIIAVLQSRFDAYEKIYEEQEAAFFTHVQEEPPEPQRFSFFSRRNRTYPF